MVSIERGVTSVARIEPIIVDAFKEGFACPVIQAGDPGYDDARMIWNGMIDKRPALIAQCSGVADVIQAVRFAGEQSLSVSIRGGGHNVTGHAVSEGGQMIALSYMRAVHVDPLRRTALVQGGATWGDFNRESAVFGLATTGGVVSTTGVADLTLSGGTGWLVGKHGLSVDNLLSVELVTANGEFLRASEDEHPDLFWALRGPKWNEPNALTPRNSGTSPRRDGRPSNCNRNCVLGTRSTTPSAHISRGPIKSRPAFEGVRSRRAHMVTAWLAQRMTHEYPKRIYGELIGKEARATTIVNECTVLTALPGRHMLQSLARLCQQGHRRHGTASQWLKDAAVGGKTYHRTDNTTALPSTFEPTFPQRSIPCAGSYRCAAQ